MALEALPTVLRASPKVPRQVPARLQPVPITVLRVNAHVERREDATVVMIGHELVQRWEIDGWGLTKLG
jgi:DNA-binding transcriptional regulator YiaG